ncbi:MAG TPA: PHP domain-containing protein, partial [Candidatus Binatus sp.]|nr:PHP domain-containing protein [Candidatus Binatus sp.]
RGIGERQRGPHLVLLARDGSGYRSLCRLLSRANLAGTKRVPQLHQALLVEHLEGLVALSGCRDGEIARRLRVGDRAGAAAVAGRYAELYGRGDGPATSGFFLELSHHLLPDDDWLVAETASLADALGLPVVVTNDVHYARPEDRELGDVLTAISHGRTLDTLADLRRPDADSYLKSGVELAGLPPGDPASADERTARAWHEGIATAGELAASCSVDLGFEQYRFPGFPVPKGETPFSYLSELCWEGARRRYHPMTPAVVNRLAHELGVIERAGLAEFFLICWDLMRFAREERIPAQGRGSATSSIVSYTLGISRVEPIQHNLLFERFINEGRTTYPDVDIDFSSERREEVIQYVYRRYGPEHTGMVCNLVTYRARSAVREVGYALGFPRPLVDRVAKALETYDSVMVRRDLEADGGFAEFFRRPGGADVTASGAGRAPVEDAIRGSAARTGERGLTDGMGQLNHVRGGRFQPDAVAKSGEVALGEELVDGLGQLNKRLPLVGKVPPWRQPPKPVDPAAPRPFAWLASGDPTDAGPAPSASGMWEEAPNSPPSIRPGRSGDDEGGPGDTPASVAWLRAGRGTGYEGDLGGYGASGSGAGPRVLESAQGIVDGRAIDPESGALGPPARRTDATRRATDRLGRPNHWPQPDNIRGGIGVDRIGRADPHRVADRSAGLGTGLARPEPHSSVARVEPEPAPQPRGGSTVGLSDWERWLEFCARIDGFPRHLSIHSGGMLVTAAPLIDIAPLERATMKDRVVVQFDKRDVESMKLIKLDLLGRGMLAAIDETIQLIEHDCATCLVLDAIPEQIPEVFEMVQAADTVGVFQIESRAQMQTLPKSRP